MDKFFKIMQQYCEVHTSEPDPVLRSLERETNLKTLSPQMMAGTFQGKLLEFISHMLQPACILEIGTFTGYAAICMARGLQPGGVLHTIEVNPELEWLIKKYIGLAGLTKSIQLHIGDAADILATMPGQFDLAYIDAGKQDNQVFFEMVLPRVRRGGFLLVDNVLWSGKVIHPAQDSDARSISAFNDSVLGDQRIESLILPVRDGLLLARKVAQ
jgi:predicted O-methyltransferase YrrM